MFWNRRVGVAVYGVIVGTATSLGYSRAWAFGLQACGFQGSGCWGLFRSAYVVIFVSLSLNSGVLLAAYALFKGYGV